MLFVSFPGAWAKEASEAFERSQALDACEAEWKLRK